jgi:hypothetical protein
MLSVQPNVKVVGCHHDCSSSRIYYPIFHALLTCQCFNNKNKKGYQATHNALVGQALASNANQEDITYDNNDDDVHNIGMMDIYKK